MVSPHTRLPSRTEFTAGEAASLQKHFDSWATTRHVHRGPDGYVNDAGRAAFVLHVTDLGSGRVQATHLPEPALEVILPVVLDSPIFLKGLDEIRDVVPGRHGRTWLPTELGLFDVVLEDTRPTARRATLRDVYNVLIVAPWAREASQRPESNTGI